MDQNTYLAGVCLEEETDACRGVVVEWVNKKGGW